VGEADQRQIAEEVMRLLTAEGFAGVFGPGSLAEVPLTALLGDGKGLSGRMDRIAFMEREVLIVDYKTNRPPPSELKDVPPQYIAQLDAYRQALRPLFPGKTIRTALIWTDGPRFMEVPAAQP
jgi:ATP-dependent helicase/nuclease subunit A